ncbi:hypothetical protein BH09BAC2_BH09BAC2_23430 [soil metagenome]
MFKKLFFDPGVIFLLLINIYCIYYYYNNPDQFNTIVILYWLQSILIGLFNFADLLTVKNAVPGSVNIGDKKIGSTSSGNRTLAFFFLLHYGFFHLVYGIFLYSFNDFIVDRHFIQIALAAFSLNLILDFARQKQWESSHSVNMGVIFFLPYFRIVPMHIMIMLSVFLGLKAAIFLFLKTIADVLMYVVTKRIHKRDLPIRSGYNNP